MAGNIAGSVADMAGTSAGAHFRFLLARAPRGPTSMAHGNERLLVASVNRVSMRWQVRKTGTKLLPPSRYGK